MRKYYVSMRVISEIMALILGRLEPNSFSTSKGISTKAPPLPAFWMVAVNVFFLAWESPE
jgi:hypothetical protein